MASAQGININNMKVLGLALSNGIVALSGGLMTQFQGTADVNIGRGAIVIGLAAIIIVEVFCCHNSVLISDKSVTLYKRRIKLNLKFNILCDSYHTCSQIVN